MTQDKRPNCAARGPGRRWEPAPRPAAGGPRPLCGLRGAQLAAALSGAATPRPAPRLPSFLSAGAPQAWGEPGAPPPAMAGGRAAAAPADDHALAPAVAAAAPASAHAAGGRLQQAAAAAAARWDAGARAGARCRPRIPAFLRAEAAA
jgi:hypothetical protein